MWLHKVGIENVLGNDITTFVLAFQVIYGKLMKHVKVLTYLDGEWRWFIASDIHHMEAE